MSELLLRVYFTVSCDTLASSLCSLGDRTSLRSHVPSLLPYPPEFAQAWGSEEELWVTLDANGLSDGPASCLVDRGSL